MKNDLPYFRYHSNPLASEAIMEDELICDCCGEMVDYVYQGPIHGGFNHVCAWCISNGEANRKLGFYFIDKHTQLEGALPSQVLEELTQRTPGIPGGKSISWPVHCNDACAFQGTLPDAEWPEPLAPAHVLSELGPLSPYETVRQFQFVCLHCDEVFVRGVKIYNDQMMLDRSSLLLAIDDISSSPLASLLNDPKKLFAGLIEVLHSANLDLFDSAIIGCDRHWVLQELERLHGIVQEHMLVCRLSNDEDPSLSKLFLALKGMYFIIYAGCVDAEESDREFLQNIEVEFAQISADFKNLKFADRDLRQQKFQAVRQRFRAYTSRIALIRERGNLPDSKITLFRFAPASSD